MLLLIIMLMVEGTWAVGLYHSWPFVIMIMAATILLVVTGVREIRQRRWIGAASHWGLVLVLLGGMLGAVVQTDVKMVVDKHASERVGYTDRGEAVVVPFALQLEDFRIDYYEDQQSPKQYTSAISLAPVGAQLADRESEANKERDKGKGLTSVNHPLRYRGWWIYQQDYDRAQGDYVVLQLVRDPWLWLVYVGFILMTAGALMQTRKAWHSWKVLPAALLIAAVFAVLSLMRIELGHLPPALRSLWFFPHILIYMIAYSLMAIALIASLLPIIVKRSGKFTESGAVSRKLFSTASSLLLIGMLCGAVWAKEAWGQYWTWDAKECWAAVTWLLSVLAMHIPPRKWWNTVVIALAFGAMQITWYGVNYLPSAPYSMHTYNR